MTTVKLIGDLPAGPNSLAGTELVEIQNGGGAGASQQTTTQAIANLSQTAISTAISAALVTAQGYATTAQSNAEAYTDTKVDSLTTSQVAEGTNEYFTQSRNAQSAVTALTISSGVVNIDLSKGSFFTLALTANVTSITFTNLPAAGFGQTIAIRIQQDSTGSRTVALPSSFHPTTGSATAVASAASAYTLLMITSFDQGTRWEYSMQPMVS